MHSGISKVVVFKVKKGGKKFKRGKKNIHETEKKLRVLVNGDGPDFLYPFFAYFNREKLCFLKKT